jgi:dipeptidyl aminopeptidase/acylaminoacyl peptidase
MSRMKYLKFTLYTLIFCMLSVVIISEENKTKEELWKPEDIIKNENAGSFKFSPDGNRALWVKTAPDTDKDINIGHIFLTMIGQKPETIQLTRSESGEASPGWSPSGKKISFLSSRKAPNDKSEAEGKQLWLMDLRGGEPWKVTSNDFGVFGYEWMDDNRILILAREGKTLIEQKAKEKKDDTIIVEDQEHMIPARLYILDIEKKKLTRLADNMDEITSFSLSHDKKWVFAEHNQSVRYEVDKKIKPRYFLMNIADKTSKELFTDPKFKPQSVYWALDDKGFYFTHKVTSDYENDGAGAVFLHYYDLAKAGYIEVPLQWDWGLFYSDIIPRKDGFVASLANGAIPKWRSYIRRGDTFSFKEIEGKHYPHIFQFILDEKSDALIYEYSTASNPAKWYSAVLDGNEIKKEKELLQVNQHFNNKKKAKTEVIKWIGALGEEVEGILYYPHNYEAGKKYPLITMLHGGPTGVDMDSFDESWATYPNLMAQRGSFCFFANYHGSDGYGRKFSESIKGRYYELEIQDIINGIDKLIAEGKVDSGRLGTIGWSNGGILSIALTTWTDRFKVAGVGAADVNWTSDYGNCSFGVSFDNYYFTGSPWDKIQHYIEKSPLFHLKNVKAPTIIFHGTEDTNVPYEQGWEHYRALQQIGKAPVRYIVFPGEPHSPRKLTHRQRKIEEELAWFDRYLFNTLKPENDAFKKDSPLDVAIRKAVFAKEGGYFGKSYNDLLIPELVKKDDIEVGRFEVTRAQWSSFDKNYKFEPVTSNYPVTNISFEQATKYASWLKEMTGEEYRLPTVQEAQKLSDSASTSGNTLNYWAGYPLNPDDARLLMEKIKALEGFSLLQQVDERPADGEEMIFGLGGNAAEWAVDEKGGGKITGKSAITYSDERGDSPVPPMEYTGLRIVKGSKAPEKPKQ